MPTQAKFDFQPQPAWRPVPEFKAFPSSLLSALTSCQRTTQPLKLRVTFEPNPAFESTPAIPEFLTRLSNHSVPVSPRGMQIQNRYIVTESDEGMMVIDQHALHERILYEQIRDRVLGGKLETQRMLVPEPVALTPPESAAAIEAQETLSQLGIEIEPFGGNTVLISAYPAMLANLGPNEVLRNVVELLLSGGKTPDRRDLLDELLHMISCKAAIKAGDRLSLDEIHAVLEQRHLFQDTHHCPHGRPTALVFSRDELDKRFKRPNLFYPSNGYDLQ